ncbi:MAG: hypothetical protein HYX60_08910 [Legionella longbeachae]|nr:hypothetical protein [Legionella longbeachae]
MSKLKKINPHIKYEILEQFKPITPEKFPQIILITSFERILKEINSNIDLHELAKKGEITLEGILKQAEKLDIKNENESYLRALLGAGLTMEEFKELEQKINEIKEDTKSFDEESSFVIKEDSENEHKVNVGTGLSNELREEIKEFHDTLLSLTGENDSRVLFLNKVLERGEQELEEASNVKVILPTNMPEVIKNKSDVNIEELPTQGIQTTNQNK